MDSSSPLSSLSSIFISNLFQTSLVGIVTIQVLVFLQRPVSGWDKLVCVTLWFLTLLHLISVVQFTYESVFVHEGDLSEVSTPWSYLVGAVLDQLISTVTQIFYAVRLWKIMKRKFFRTILFTILGLLLAVSLVLDVYVPYQLSQVPKISGMLSITFRWAVMLALTLTSAIDCTLSATLVVTLYTANKRSDWTDNQLYIVVAYLVNSGAVASALSIVPPFAYMLMPENFIFLALRFVLTALYLNCLLAMLNAQHYLEDWSNSSSQDVYVYNGSTGFRQRPSQQPLAPRATINEVGLPLFEGQSNNRLKMGRMNGEIPLVEVNVVKEEVHQSELDSKNYYHRER
ncbi:hypothetical protein PM082_020008 [Marasmius tenuissimus]|nr:hypothetical protein PM082_020008 [Marasmius tenuissimus]